MSKITYSKQEFMKWSVKVKNPNNSVFRLNSTPLRRKSRERGVYVENNQFRAKIAKTGCISKNIPLRRLIQKLGLYLSKITPRRTSTSKLEYLSRKYIEQRKDPGNWAIWSKIPSSIAKVPKMGFQVKYRIKGENSKYVWLSQK